ncbi:MAG TPA: hypothetical protein VFJ15_01375 [Oleiagrimonas sp.]|nr:hypothetical protein [Oleiagrimonas sp.]
MRLLLGLALLIGSGACVAGTHIHHCVAADGTPVFTDKPCASLGAMPTDRATNPLSPRGTHPVRHCPMDMDALRKRVARVFRAGNANALAGLMLWRGYGENAAADTVQHLAELMRSPFLGLVETVATTAPVTSTSTWPPWRPLDPQPSLVPGATDTIIVKMGNPSRPRIAFNVIRRDGCLWLDQP